MMGPTHATFGALSWFAVAPLVVSVTGPLTPAQTLVGAMVCCGFGLWPDIDEPHSTVSRSIGPVTVALSHAIVALSAAWYNVTKSPRENYESGGHRKLTHNWLGVGAVTVLVALLCGVGGKVAAIAVTVFATMLAMRGLMGKWAKKQGWVVSTAVAAAVGFLAFQMMPGGSYWWLFAAVLVGQLAHVAGDFPTKDGVPFTAPIPHRGKNWWDWALPAVLRFRAGGWVEYGVLMPLFTFLLTDRVVFTATGVSVVGNILRMAHLVG